MLQPASTTGGSDSQRGLPLSISLESNASMSSKISTSFCPTGPLLNMPENSDLRESSLDGAGYPPILPNLGGISELTSFSLEPRFPSFEPTFRFLLFQVFITSRSNDICNLGQAII